jgi:DNA modification methylase
MIDLINTVITGDCLEVMKSLPDKCVDLVLTDPPYGIGYWSNRSDAHEVLVNDGFEQWNDNFPIWIKEFSRIMTDTACCCCCCGGGKTPVSAIATLELTKHMELIQTLVWDKMTIGLGWRYRPSYETILVGSKSKDNYNFFDESKACSNILRFNNVIPARNEHPTQKPVDLMKKLVQIHSNREHLILDPFAGSGTTLVAAKQLGRKYIGIEINPDYVKICNQRLAQEELL